MKSKKMKVIVLYYAVLCSLANILHYMASRPRRQSSLETAIRPYVILSHAAQNSVSFQGKGSSSADVFLVSSGVRVQNGMLPGGLQREGWYLGREILVAWRIYV